MEDVVVNCDSEGGELGVSWIEIGCGGVVADAVTRMEHRVREDKGGCILVGVGDLFKLKGLSDCNIESKFMILAKFRYLQLRGNITCNQHLGWGKIFSYIFLGLTVYCQLGTRPVCIHFLIQEAIESYNLRPTNSKFQRIFFKLRKINFFTNLYIKFKG